MAAADYYVYSGDGVSVTAHRPSLENVGGAAKEDDQAYPPDPITMPTADDWNQLVQLVAYYSKVIPVCTVTVSFSAGAPVFSFFQALDPNLSSTDLTLTDNGNGDTSITWDAGDFPTRNLYPSGLTLNADAAIDEHFATPIANGIRVYTQSGGVGTNCAFTVNIHG